MDSAGSELPVGSNRRYFTDDRAQTWWIERMGRLDEKTIFWIGGVGHEPTAFASDHEREGDFTVTELYAALVEHLGIALP
jgi:hypothetical protein